MHKKIYKLGMLLFVLSFLLSSSTVFATNYGYGDYGSGFYSSDIPDVVPPLTPVSYPVAGTYNSTQSIILSSIGSDYIRYSKTELPTNCSSGSLYSSPIVVSTSQTIYVIACDNSNNSSVTSFSYIISVSNNSSNRGSSGGGSFVSKIETVTPSTVIEPADIYKIPNTNILISRNLSLKSKGDDVKILQIFLKNKKYSISYVDGIFGNETKSAVIEFQKSNKLYADGIVGPETLRLIKNYYVINNDNTVVNTIDKMYVFSRKLKFGLTTNDPDEIYQLQKYLNSHGYLISITGPGSPGNENRYFGPLTRKALMKFQSANKLYPDGVFGSKTIELINKIK